MKNSSSTKTILAIGIAVAILYFVSQKDTFTKFMGQQFETVVPSVTGVPSSRPDVITIVPQITYAPTLVPSQAATMTMMPSTQPTMLPVSMMPTMQAVSMMPTMKPVSMMPTMQAGNKPTQVGSNLLAPFGNMSPTPFIANPKP